MEDFDRTLLVVVGPPSYRKPQEAALFTGCSSFKSLFLFSPPGEPWSALDAPIETSGLDKSVPDTLARLAVREPYSPVSFVELENPEKALANVDAVNSIELYSFISRQCAEIARKPLIVSVFETIASPILHKLPPFSHNVKKVLKKADLFIAYTHRSAEYLRAFGVSDDKICVVYPGIDLNTFCGPRLNIDGIRILFVGGAAGEKGLKALLEAFTRLSTSRKNVELWICAKPRGKREAELMEAYSRKGSVVNLGYVPREKIPEVYRRCDIFCLSSHDQRRLGMKVWEEQFGFALVEAMASCLPVVATRCGVIPEIVGEKNLIVKQNSVEDISFALEHLVEDEDLRLRIGRSNRERAERFFDLEKQRAIIDKTVGDILQ